MPGLPAEIALSGDLAAASAGRSGHESPARGPLAQQLGLGEALAGLAEARVSLTNHVEALTVLGTIAAEQADQVEEARKQLATSAPETDSAGIPVDTQTEPTSPEAKGIQTVETPEQPQQPAPVAHQEPESTDTTVNTTPEEIAPQQGTEGPRRSGSEHDACSKPEPSEPQATGLEEDVSPKPIEPSEAEQATEQPQANSLEVASSSKPIEPSEAQQVRDIVGGLAEFVAKRFPEMEKGEDDLDSIEPTEQIATAAMPGNAPAEQPALTTAPEPKKPRRRGKRS
jgi:hypothetical protein